MRFALSHELARSVLLRALYTPFKTRHTTLRATGAPGPVLSVSAVSALFWHGDWARPHCALKQLTIRGLASEMKRGAYSERLGPSWAFCEWIPGKRPAIKQLKSLITRSTRRVNQPESLFCLPDFLSNKPECKSKSLSKSQYRPTKKQLKLLQR